MWKRDVAIVVLALLVTTMFAGCTGLTDAINGRGERVTLMPVPATPTPTATPTPGPTPAPTPVPTPSPSPTPSPTPAPTATPTPEPTPTPTPEPTPEPVYQADTRVTAGINVMQPFGIWDHYIVYDEKAGSDGSYFIHLYDISTGNDQTIATGNVRSYGCIGGEDNNGKVGLIFSDFNRIMIYDINSGALEQVVAGSSQPYKSPAIDGGHLMYVNQEGITGSSFANIYDYDTVSKTLSLVMPGPDPNDVRFSGSMVAWWYRSNNIRKIMLARNDIDGGVRTISPADVTCDHPRISGNLVVYHCTVNGSGYISVYDINAKTTERVTSVGSQSSCDIHGSRIVYDDGRDGNWNIYMTDRATGQETRLTNEPHDQTGPQISGSYVAYIDSRNGSPDLYVLTIA